MTLKIPPLQTGTPIVNERGCVNPQFQRQWDLTVGALANVVNAITAIPAIQTALADVATATAAANAAASAAQGAANTVTAESALANSYVTGLTLSAADAGTDVTITISAHTRVYGNGVSVAVSGGTVTGVPYATVARVYYDQPSRAGGAVSYQWTASSTTAAQTGDRHSVGVVTTPAALGAPATGKSVRPPGYVEP